MTSKISAIAECTKSLARNPLGIIAMFIVLVYGFASAMAGFSEKLERSERLPVIWFLVVFPVLVLFTFEPASSTDEATGKIDQCRFDLIISDMNRPGELRAGLALLSRLRSEGNCTPYILYSAPATAEHQAEAWKRGAVGMTDRPHEL